jgi:hypothetical protein
MKPGKKKEGRVKRKEKERDKKRERTLRDLLNTIALDAELRRDPCKDDSLERSSV